MEDEKSRLPGRMILLVGVLFALLASGCPKTQETASPTAEERKEPAEIVKPEQVPPQAAAQPLEKPAPPALRTSQPPVVSGETLLDPTVPRDAKMIQARLAELGLYKGEVDGVWGRLSRAALKSFKEKNALGDPENWNRETQVLLFRGASLTPQPASGMGKSPISSGETLLDPAVTRDAQMIQSRLAELGFYKGAIDGKWGRMSRAALKSFKEENALGSLEDWDKETQIRLFRETGK